MFKTSKSTFFLQSKKELENKKQLMGLVLDDYKFSDNQIYDFFKAYNYFTEYPKEFDGATIVRDFNTIKNLDAPAMLHDYQYILSSGIKERMIADKEYLKNMIKLDVHPVSAYLRYVFLIILNISGIYTIYKWIISC